MKEVLTVPNSDDCVLTVVMGKKATFFHLCFVETAYFMSQNTAFNFN